MRLNCSLQYSHTCKFRYIYPYHSARTELTFNYCTQGYKNVVI